MLRYVDRRPALIGQRMAAAARKAQLIRIGSLLSCAAASTAIAAVDIRYFGLGYAWMMVAAVWSRRVARAGSRLAPA